MSEEINNELTHSLRRLKGCNRQQLKERWRKLFRTAPSVAFTPDLLVRGIAWRLQEQVYGGLSADSRTMLGKADPASPSRPKRLSSLRPGNRLVRRWRGKTYVVDITEAGLVHDGADFASLSEIARHITGTRWSGPRFFGLVE